MQKIILFFLVVFAKILAFLSRVSKRGSGTSLPGLLVEKYFVDKLAYLAKDMLEIIMISGTNGKTTTRAVLVDIYEKQNIAICTNRGGANILRGIASTLLLNLDFKLKPKKIIAILEVEEASLPILTKYIKPSSLILTNLFRDQLDVYGEIDQTLNYFRQTLDNINIPRKRTAPTQVSSTNQLVVRQNKSRFNLENGLAFLTKPGFKLFINYDDKKLLSLLDEFEVASVGFSLDLDEAEKPTYELADKVQASPNYTFVATNILSRQLRTSFTVKIGEDMEYLVETKLPGIYNIYNILAAFLIGFIRFKDSALESIKNFEPVFGRAERINLNSKTSLVLFLIKNPAGFNQTLQLIEQNYTNEEVNLVICINDKIADGRDVSWLWDVELESFLQNQSYKTILTGGTRSADMLLRLEYAGAKVHLYHDYDNFLDLLAEIEKIEGEVLVLSTYTALLEFRKLLSTKTELKSISDSGN